MPRQVDYYFSLSSPWAYIGHKVFRDLVATYGLKVNHKPVVLVDLFSETGGLPLVKRHPVRQRYRMVELQRWRDKRGLNFHLKPKFSPLNARLADGVVIAAIEAGFDPDPFLRRAFPAVWEDELNLADPDTVAKITDGAGLPGQSWSRARRRRPSARPMSRTGRMRLRPTCSARRSMCSTARCSGARTASNYWRTR
jgi:2-hydroxychromene-2-carboxylate isomerase